MPSMETENSNVLRAEEIKLLANEAFKARLEEYGSAIQDMAMQYRMHQGLLKLIPNIRRHALQSETFVGDAASVTCFMGITSSVFSSLLKEKQDFILTSSVNTALNDEFSSVRSAVCRAFGVITCFP
ncbi:hypothetical protein LOK49_LG10G01568 [Camellia lanceoleosa]|uniref:Uncharacterized protein n=1 Tax=Camellia lanceoleosa TaxID=1840588 RepID=A0ACC0G5H4_9ERIC|nr:hypothetical protein LOK49_LG10G01568 [Camellia lanceoleosa]